MTTNPSALNLGQPRFDGVAQTGSAAQAAWSGLLQRQGPAATAAQVHGDFAVGLQQPGGEAFLAVDRFAAQTLCYRVENTPSGDALRFAERADALATPAGGGKPELDPQALFDYLYFHCIPSPRTVFKGVHRLPPGRYAHWQNSKLTVAPYWTPTFTSTAKPSFDDLKAEFREHLKTAVKRQLGGSKPACFLSGGTDSSTVAGMLVAVTGGPVDTYSIGFEAEGYDEMVYARLAAKRFGARHHEYYVTPDDLVKSIGHVAASYDQPFGNSSAVPAFYCAQHARQDGVTRILAGDGGDELFGGNTRYAQQEIFGWYSQVPGFLRKGLMEPFFGIGAVGKTPLLKKGTGYIRQANTPLPDRLQAFNLVKRLGYDNVLDPGFLAQVNPALVGQEQAAVWAEARSASEIDEHLAYDWRYTLAESDLPKVRGTTALAGVQVGFPMLDDDLLAFSMRLPPQYKLSRLRLRWFFKEALRGFLPDEIITKKKQGFGLPFGVWAMKHEALRQLASDSARSFATRGVVQPRFVDELLNTHLPAHPHYYGTMLWILMMAEQWMRVHTPDWRLQR
jgi:asparagine synthase (glutamine-hydrolysing)